MAKEKAKTTTHHNPKSSNTATPKMKTIARATAAQANAKTTGTQTSTEVVYQRLNGVWYAFATQGNQAYFSRVDLTGGNKAPSQSVKSRRKR